MKRDRSSVEKRRAQILKMIREQEEVKVEQLAKEFGLSFMTVRRDLQYLEDRQLISRFYGGATANLAARPMTCLLYTSPSPRDRSASRMPSSA